MTGDLKKYDYKKARNRKKAIDRDIHRKTAARKKEEEIKTEKREKE